jgi:hypothetical protein
VAWVAALTAAIAIQAAAAARPAVGPAVGAAAGSAAAPSPGPGSSSVPGPASAQVADLLDKLSGAADSEVEGLVRRIEQAAAAPTSSAVDAAGLPDALFIAARACEERLLDPARALALYDQILARFGDARVAVAAERRSAHLHAQLSASGGGRVEAQAFARLVAASDGLPLEEALRRADALAAADWPGAAEVMMWSAELERRRGALEAAMARYRRVQTRFPGTPEATLAARGLAGAAVERGEWALAEQLAKELPATQPADAITQAELLAKVAAGRRAARWFLLAQLTLVGCATLLLGSSLQIVGWARPRTWAAALWPPPLEVLFMAPVAAVMVGASFTANVAIAPAVSLISGGGLALSWLSGAGLTAARRQRREERWRGPVHITLIVVAVACLAYIAVTRSGLLDLLIATVRMGPER